MSPKSPASSDEDQAEAPLTMAASVHLTELPKDALHALATAGELDVEKVRIHLQPIGAAPRLTQLDFTIKAAARFDVVVRQIRKKLRLEAHQSVFCYVGNVFAPALDETVGNLWRCFRQGERPEKLYVGYAMSPSFG